MTRKITKSGSISRRRLLATVSAGAALAASQLLQAQEANIKIGFPVPLTGLTALKRRTRFARASS